MSDDLEVDQDESAEAEAISSIVGIIRESKVLPVGFIGSGFSRRYLSSPDWAGLLEHLASLTKYPLNRYMNLKSGDPASDYPSAATRISQAFYDIWWNDDKYSSQREEFSRQISDQETLLKIQAAEHLRAFAESRNADHIDELTALREARFQAFITTNYDSLLEEIFPDFVAYSSQTEALFSPTYEIGEIYKVHGTLSQPATMVLTEGDYEHYARKNPYLIAKMLILFAENPILFFGYSLGDSHIQQLLEDLANCLTAEQLETLQGRLIFVGRKSDARPARLRKSRIIINGNVFEPLEVGLTNWGPLFAELADLPYHFAPRVLRRLRESVYSAARDSERTQRVSFVDIEDGDDLSELDIVLGVGLLEKISDTGYSTIPPAQYLQECLCGEVKLDALKLASHAFPLYRQRYMPTHYVERLAANQHQDLRVEDQRQLRDWRSRALGLKPNLTPSASDRLMKSASEVIESTLKRYRKENILLGLDFREEEDVVALRDYILPLLESDEKLQSDVVKMTSLFDGLVYGGRFGGDLRALYVALDIPIALMPKKVAN